MKYFSRIFLILSLIAFTAQTKQFSATGTDSKKGCKMIEKSHNWKLTEKIYFQSHRGGRREVPENTMAAFRYAWKYKSIPEADVGTTKDGVMVCLHDNTLARTTNAPDSIKKIDLSELTLAEIKKWDAGVKFSPEFAGEKIPTLEELFQEMQGHPENQAYLDLKELDLQELGNLIEKYGVGSQIIFCHNVQENLIKFQKIAPNVRTMLWIGGSKPEDIKQKFKAAQATNFKGLNQVQLHLHHDKSKDKIEYLLDAEFLKYALEICNQSNLDLEVLPFEIDCPAIGGLLDLGIRWLCTDYPKRLTECIDKWRNQK